MEEVLKWVYGVCAVIAFTLFFFIDNEGYRSICIWISIIAGFGLVDLFLFKKLQKGKNVVSQKQNILFLSCVLAIGVVLVVLGQIDSIEQREAAIILIAFFGVVSILSAIGTVKLIRQHRNKEKE